MSTPNTNTNANANHHRNDVNMNNEPRDDNLQSLRRSFALFSRQAGSYSDDLCAALQQCLTAVPRSFPGEDLQDWSNADLRWALVPVMEADVSLQAPIADPATSLSSTASSSRPNLQSHRRIQLLNRCLVTLLQHMDQCVDLGLAMDSDREWRRLKEPWLHRLLLHQQSLDQHSFSTTATESQLPRGSRDDKIARFKRQRELTARLASLAHQLTDRVSLDTLSEVESSSSTAAFKAIVIDEEVERDWLLDMHRSMMLRSMDTLETGLLEYQMLASRLANDFSAFESVSSTACDLASVMDRTGPLMDRRGKPLRPFTITSRRQELREQVFRPGHRLPTLSIDEYLQKEFERGNVITGGGNAGGNSDGKAIMDDNDENALNQETMRLRAFDDFKDDHPRGWGNRGGNRG